MSTTAPSAAYVSVAASDGAFFSDALRDDMMLLTSNTTQRILMGTHPGRAAPLRVEAGRVLVTTPLALSAAELCGTPDGALGIGTSSPMATLHVNGTFMADTFLGLSSSAHGAVGGAASNTPASAAALAAAYAALSNMGYAAMQAATFGSNVGAAASNTTFRTAGPALLATINSASNTAARAYDAALMASNIAARSDAGTLISIAEGASNIAGAALPPALFGSNAAAAASNMAFRDILEQVLDVPNGPATPLVVSNPSDESNASAGIIVRSGGAELSLRVAAAAGVGGEVTCGDSLPLVFGSIPRAAVRADPAAGMVSVASQRGLDIAAPGGISVGGRVVVDFNSRVSATTLRVGPLQFPSAGVTVADSPSYALTRDGQDAVLIAEETNEERVSIRMLASSAQVNHADTWVCGPGKYDTANGLPEPGAPVTTAWDPDVGADVQVVGEWAEFEFVGRDVTACKLLLDRVLVDDGTRAPAGLTVLQRSLDGEWSVSFAFASDIPHTMVWPASGDRSTPVNRVRVVVTRCGIDGDGSCGMSIGILYRQGDASPSLTVDGTVLTALHDGRLGVGTGEPSDALDVHGGGISIAGTQVIAGDRAAHNLTSVSVRGSNACDLVLLAVRNEGSGPSAAASISLCNDAGAAWVKMRSVAGGGAVELCNPGGQLELWAGKGVVLTSNTALRLPGHLLSGGGSNTLLAPVSVRHGVDVGGHLTVHSNVTAHAPMCVDGVFSACNHVTVHGNATFCNNVRVGTNATIYGTLATVGPATLCNATLLMGRTTLCNALVSTGHVTLLGASNTISNAVLIGSASMCNGLNVAGPVTFAGPGIANLTQATMCNGALVYGAFVGVGNATLCNSLRVSGPVIMTGLMSACNSLWVSSNATVAQCLSVLGSQSNADGFSVAGALAVGAGPLTAPRIHAQSNITLHAGAGVSMWATAPQQVFATTLCNQANYPGAAWAVASDQPGLAGGEALLCVRGDSGAVGIRTSSPSSEYALDVNGDVHASGRVHLRHVPAPGTAHVFNARAPSQACTVGDLVHWDAISAPVALADVTLSHDGAVFTATVDGLYTTSVYQWNTDRADEDTDYEWDIRTTKASPLGGGLTVTAAFRKTGSDSHTSYLRAGDSFGIVCRVSSDIPPVSIFPSTAIVVTRISHPF